VKGIIIILGMPVVVALLGMQTGKVIAWIVLEPELNDVVFPDPGQPQFFEERQQYFRESRRISTQHRRYRSRGMNIGLLVGLILGIGIVARGDRSVCGRSRQTEMLFCDAIGRAKGCKELVQAIGWPIKTRNMRGGQFSVDSHDGWARVTISLSGLKATAVLYVDAERLDGAWVYKTLRAMIDYNGQEVDLLT
jgi:hypothetical protein